MSLFEAYVASRAIHLHQREQFGLEPPREPLKRLRWEPDVIPREATLRRLYLDDRITVEEYEREVGILLATGEMQ